MKEIKYIDERKKDLVFGFVNESRQELPEKINYYDIPSLIRYMILYYLYHFSVELNQLIDFKNDDDKWYIAQVKEISSNNPRHIGLYGIESCSKFNIWIDLDLERDRCCPLNTFTSMTDIWEKRSKVIGGTRRRILVEWHFMTSNDESHTVILQNTESAKPRTRKMLWVDGVEKYNHKTAVSSFRIEIDKDVVIITIDKMEQYHYKLQINSLSFMDAFQSFKARHHI